MQVLKGPKGLRLCCQRGESLRTQCTPRLGPTQVTYAFEHPHHRHVEMVMRYADMLQPRLRSSANPDPNPHFNPNPHPHFNPNPRGHAAAAPQEQRQP